MANWRTYIDPSIGDGQNTLDGIIANGPTYGIQISDDLNVTGLSTFSDVARFSNTVRLDGQLRDGDNSFGTSGQVLSSDGTDTRWINAASLSAGAASQIAINSDTNDAERFITFVNSSSGNNNLNTDTQLKYNPSTNQLNFTASASGIKFGPGTAASDDAHIEWLGGSNAGYLRISTSDDGGSEYIQFGDYDNQDKGGTFTQWLRISRDTGTFTGTFSATTLSGSLNASNLTGTVNTARLPNTYTKAGQVVVQATGAGNDVRLDAADNIILESGEEESGAIYFRGNNGASSYRFSKGGQTTHEGFLSFESLGADRTFTFPDVTGTVALTSSDITGNAATATNLAASKNFEISGEITANAVSFDGSNGVNLSATVANNIIDEDNLMVSNDPVDGYFLSAQSGDTGGLTWAQVDTSANALTGSTLANNITTSSITSLGNLSGLTVNGSSSVRDIILQAGYHLRRSDHHSGHLEGSYNNVGNNNSKTNPIYSIGSSFNPNDATLSNFYGIGFTNDNASFISFTGSSGWGLYVAADGDARVWLDGSNGVISSTGEHYVGSDKVWHEGNLGVGDGGLTQKNFTTTLKNKLDGIANNANNYTHPSHNGDDFSIDTGHLSGATVIDDLDINVTTDSSGHVTDCNATVATRNLTLANLGYTGDTNANRITNNNQISNGAGYITSSEAAGRTNLRSFGSNTTYTPSSGTQYIHVHVIGAGGGGSSGTELQGEESGDQRAFGGAGGGGYCIGHYNITGSFTGSITVGSGGAGGQQHSSQYRAGGTGGHSRFQPSGSYNGAGRLTANGGGGAPAGQGNGSGGGAQAQQGIGFNGHRGQRVKYGFGGEHGSSALGYGGISGHGDGNKGKGADGKSSAEQFTGNSGSNGFVYIFEFLSN